MPKPYPRELGLLQVRDLIPFYEAGLPVDLQERIDARNRDLMRKRIAEIRSTKES